ncbi:hypothetical protein LCGC14_2207830 [marine sediment metagenome]|uniref:Uncharacterized protein n=1 Tax=marine sediment metagenome TaxID=412755 RepID=A0A0F9GAJ2_9ZZZZ
MEQILILGLNPIVLTILMVIAGVGITNTLGWLQSSNPINPRKIGASVIISTVVAFAIIMPVVQGMLKNVGADEYTQLMAIVIGVGVLSLVGADTLIKNVGHAIKNKK